MSESHMRVNVKPGAVMVGGQEIPLETRPDLVLHPGVNTGTIEVQTFFGPVSATYHVTVPEAGQ